MERVVIKVGGSLLTQPRLQSRLLRFVCERFSGQQVFLVTGGGEVVEALRELDQVHSFDPPQMHWLCIEALQITFRVVGELLPNFQRIETRKQLDELHGRSEADICLVAVGSFYGREDGNLLPCDWTTTSDSLAALLAKRLNAKQLWLLKSCEIPEGLRLEEAVCLGMVDQNLPQMADGLQITFCQLPD